VVRAGQNDALFDDRISPAAMRMSEKTNNRHGFEAGEDHISNL
jgi:hypothetical protein